MIYELREYVAAPGAAEALHRRFAEHTLGLFDRHGMRVAGFWSDVDDAERIVYLLAFPDEDARRDAWRGFQADPEWLRVKKESESAGPLVAEMHARTLTEVPYWGQNGQTR